MYDDKGNDSPTTRGTDYDMDIGEGYSYIEIAEIMGITPKEVRIIEAKALRKLKLNKEAYMLFLDYIGSMRKSKGSTGL